MYKLSFVINVSLFLALSLNSKLSFGFADALALLEKGNKKVLFIADRHIESNGLEPELRDHELGEIKTFRAFAAQLAQKGVSHTWVVESSAKTMENIDTKTIQSELLYALPDAVFNLANSKSTSEMEVVLSDYRREVVKEFFLLSPSLTLFVLNSAVQTLDDKNLWSRKDIAWRNAVESEVNPSDLIPRIDSYYQSHQGFRNEMDRLLERVDLRVKAVEDEQIGMTTSLGTIRRKFSSVTNEFAQFEQIPDSPQARAFSRMRSVLANCDAILTDYMTQNGAKLSDSLSRVVVDAAKKSKSLMPLYSAPTSELGRCVTVAIADAGFLVDIMRSQANGKLTIVFVGGAHATYLANTLELSGYTKRFEDGKLSGAKGLRALSRLDGADKPFDNSALRARLRALVAEFSVPAKDEL